MKPQKRQERSMDYLVAERENKLIGLLIEQNPSNLL